MTALPPEPGRIDDVLVPQPKRTAPITEPRVMRLEELHDADRRAVERAIAKARPDLSQIVDAQVVEAEAYCGNRAALKDFRHMQQINSDVTGRWTYLHVHAYDDDCAGHDHETFQPDPRRAEALGTNTR